MGVKFKRQKERVWLLTIIYRLNKLFSFISRKKRFKFYLDMEWIFDRLASEEAFEYYKTEDHPLRQFSLNFLFTQIDQSSVVCDLGCKYGDISYQIALKAKEVVGVDFDTVALEIAREKYQRENLEFVEEEAFAYVERVDKKFDALILSHIVEHLDHPVDFLKKAITYFDKIYIELPDFDKYYLNYYRLDLGNKLVYTDDDHINEFTREDLVEVLNKAGLKILDAEYRFGIQKIWCVKQ